MDNISSLNSLLATVKTANRELVPFDMKADETNRAEQKRTYQQNTAAQKALHHALITRDNNQTATGFRLEGGEQRVMGTIGCLTNDSMLYYAKELGSRYCMNGIKLLAIVEFLDAE